MVRLLELESFLENPVKVSPSQLRKDGLETNIPKTNFSFNKTSIRRGKKSFFASYFTPIKVIILLGCQGLLRVKVNEKTLKGKKDNKKQSTGKQMAIGVEY